VLLCACAANTSKSSETQAIIQLDEIDAHVRGFTETFFSRVGEKYDDIATHAKSPEERTWALQHRLGQSIATLADATGPNPSVNLMNVTVMITFTRMSIEEHWIPTLLHDDGKELLAAYKQSEKEAWDLSVRVFTPVQLQALRDVMDQWKRDNPTVYYTGFIKFTDFAIKKAPGRSKNMPSNLLSLLYIDPLAGLDPVALEAHDFRMLSERILYLAVRVPIVMNWQLEEAVDRILNDPQIMRLIDVSDEYSKVGNRFNEIVAKYPSDLSQITRAAIDQINAAATVQRQAAVKELNSEYGNVHGLLADARGSIDTARQAAASINSDTTQTLNVARNDSDQILNRTFLYAVMLIVVGFAWPAAVLLVYKRLSRRGVQRG
jgi:hypothetical protein